MDIENANMTINIIPLNPNLIHQANSVSFGGERGNHSNAEYMQEAQIILDWPISENKKAKLLKTLHDKRSMILNYEAQHVSVMVAGPSNYNAKRLDKSDTILQLCAELHNWLQDIDEQVRAGTATNDKAAHYVEMIEFCANREPDLAVGKYFIALASLDNAEFIRLYDKYQHVYKWRKNSGVYKLHEQSLRGEISEIKKEVIVEHTDFMAYVEGERAFIKFTMRPKRQLIVALKSRGWWWNNHVGAWSTYPNKADWDWVKSISERYADYI